MQSNQLVPADIVLEAQNYIGIWCDEVFVNGNRRKIPFCSPVYNEASGTVTIVRNEIKYVLRPGSLWNGSKRTMDRETLDRICSVFLDTPYLWGGKSVFGIDCSGFVQQVFKIFGLKLLRDAYLQAEQGNAVESLDTTALGDLAFFQNEKGRVTHVGILLGKNEIVHASGKVWAEALL